MSKPTKYYVPLWIKTDSKDGDTELAFFFIEPKKHRGKDHKYWIVSASDLTSMCVFEHIKYDYSFTKTGIQKIKKYLHHSPKLMSSVNEFLRVGKLIDKLSSIDYVFAKELIIFINSTDDKEQRKRSKHLIKLINKHCIYIKPYSIDKILDNQSINASFLDDYCINTIALMDDPEFAVDHLDDDTYNDLEDKAYYLYHTDSNKQIMKRIQMLKPLLC